MKKYLLLAVTALLWIQAGAQSTLTANEPFEGSITFQNSFTGPDAMQLQEAKVPQKMDQHYRQGDFIINMYEGAFPKTLLYLNKYDHVFVVDMKNRRLFKSEPYRERIKQTPKAVATGDSLKITVSTGNGQERKTYTCYAYSFVRPAVGRDPEKKITVYITPEIRVDMGYFANKDKSQAFFLIDGLNGCIPLKTIVRTPTLTTTNVATKVVRKTLPAESFAVPKGFKLDGIDYRR